MSPAGHTTVIRRVLERRGAPVSHPADTTATIAVMLRVLPPPRLLLALRDDGMRAQLADKLSAELVAVETVATDAEALNCLEQQGHHILLTDSLELTRQTRRTLAQRNPVILFLLEGNGEHERYAALAAGADDCVAHDAMTEELHARVALARRVAELETVLRTTLTENRKLSTVDELTGVASRRFFGKHFPREVDRAARYARPVSLLLCDIDFFKRINDTLGHIAGDVVLQQFGGRLMRNVRQSVDWVARIGGEEFAVVLPETTYESAVGAAHKLCRAVARTPFKVDGRNLTVTASFGVCGLDRVPVGRKDLPQRMLKVADAALYRSKREGRNRLTAARLPEADSQADPGGAERASPVS